VLSSILFNYGFGAANIIKETVEGSGLLFHLDEGSGIRDEGSGILANCLLPTANS
jgi:hypothetical protein